MVSEMNEPLSEQFHKVGERWADLESAAALLEDCKSAVMAQRMAALGDMPVNRAEMTVKASPEWTEYITKTNNARRAANLAKVEVEAMRMRYGEWSSQEANARVEARL